MVDSNGTVACAACLVSLDSTPQVVQDCNRRPGMKY